MFTQHDGALTDARWDLNGVLVVAGVVQYVWLCLSVIRSLLALSHVHGAQEPVLPSSAAIPSFGTAKVCPVFIASAFDPAHFSRMDGSPTYLPLNLHWRCVSGILLLMRHSALRGCACAVPEARSCGESLYPTSLPAWDLSRVLKRDSCCERCSDTHRPAELRYIADPDRDHNAGQSPGRQ